MAKISASDNVQDTNRKPLHPHIDLDIYSALPCNQLRDCGDCICKRRLFLAQPRHSIFPPAPPASCSISMTLGYSSSPEIESSSTPPSTPSTMSCLSSQPSEHQTITARPKLTLQTTSLPKTFGSSTTGLSLSFTTGHGVSPTIRNTFKNAYDVTSPSSTTSSPSKTVAGHRFLNTKPTSPYIHHQPTSSTFNTRYPYQLPLGVRSILRNSPLDKCSHRRSGSISAGASSTGTRRVFFPPKKQVTYRNPLEEDIRTEIYTAQHWDLVQEGEEKVEDPMPDNADLKSESAPAEDGGPEDSDSGNTSLSETSSDEYAGGQILSKTERKKRRTLSAERQVRAVALLDGLDADLESSSTPQTPRQGRVKRRRDWKWTLGPLDVGAGDGDECVGESRAHSKPCR